MIIDFRNKRRNQIIPITINNENVDIVNSFKFLGTYISNDLKWEENTNNLTKKAHKRLYLLRQLNKFKLKKNLLVNFYRAAIESIITFSITVWYGNIEAKQKKKLSKIIKTSEKIIGAHLPSLENTYLERNKKKTKSILLDSLHPANTFFQLMPSGRRYRSIKAKNNRFSNSFYPRAIRLISN